MLAVLLVAGSAQLLYAPYKDAALNKLEFLSLHCASAVILLGLLFSSTVPTSVGFDVRGALGALCIVLISLFIAVFIAITITHICACGGVSARVRVHIDTGCSQTRAPSSC